MATGKIVAKAFSNMAYSQAQDISALAALNGTFLTPDNGFIFGQLVKDADASDAQYELQIGGKIVVRYQSGANNAVYSSFCVPVSKGSNIIVTRCVNMYFTGTTYLPKFVAI